jgi:hypothetical protein
VAAALLPAGTAAAQGGEAGRLLYWWTQAGADGEWQLRTVYDGGGACPAPAAMRALPDTAFPVLVCQQVVGDADGEARVGGRRVGRPAEARRVVVIGDTGCRVRDQNCADPGSWPFSRVAAAAARARGDLTIHVGDYIYRERCTAGVPGPCGDNWPTWEAEWFRPAGELLAAAPWVFARGNHEDCSRGGRGWFRFFDPRPVPGSGCEKATEPYAVRVPGLGRLLILDTACATWYSDCWPGRLPDGRAANDSATAVRTYAAQLRRLAELARGEEDAWLVTHVPIWDVDQAGHPDSLGSYLLQAALRQVSRGELPAAVGLQVVGHTHVWEVIDFAGARPPVLVAGNGGTSEGVIPPVPPGTRKVIDGVAVEGFWKTTAFGYTLLEPVGPGWRATLRPVETACTISAGQAVC